MAFMLCFFQKHWDTVGESVCKVVLRVLNERELLRDLNKTRGVDSKGRSP